MPRTYWVYILASRSRRTYTGVTNDLRRRVMQHRAGTTAFSERYQTLHLVYFEGTANVRAAIAREKELKRWRRERKVALIETTNAGWLDLARDWYR